MPRVSALRLAGSLGLLAAVALAGAPGATPAAIDSSPQGLRLVNPYRNLPSWWKGQVHCHSRRSDGWLAPRDVLARYRDAGYDFVALTDHRKIHRYWFDGPTSCETARTNPAPDLAITYIPSLELGQPPHILLIGVPDAGGPRCTPPGARLPRDGGRFACWIEEQGGLAVAAHPRTGTGTDTGADRQRVRARRKYHWSPEALREATSERGCLRAMEIVGLADIHTWDQLLHEGHTVWAYLSDDAHRPAQIDARGYVVVNAQSPVAPPSREELLDNLKAGNFYAVRQGFKGRSLPRPGFRAVRTRLDPREGWRIEAEVENADVYSCVYGSKPTSRHAVCRETLDEACAARILAGAAGVGLGLDERLSALRQCRRDECLAVCPPRGGLDGSEGYVRIELENDEGAVAYSQAIRIEADSGALTPSAGPH